jgi:phage shock protein PspC (stress-responsive transcriptional regulator)
MYKKLYLGNGYIGGVCEGLGDWSGLPSILWRIAFLFIFPYAFWIYVILWFFLDRKNNDYENN